VFENRALRKIFRTKREAVTEGRKKLFYGKFITYIYSTKYYYCNQMAGPQGKRALDEIGRRWKDNIKIYIKQTGYERVWRFIWLRRGSMQGFENTTMNVQVLQKAGHN
jgi:hypothetical protein